MHSDGDRLSLRDLVFYCCDETSPRREDAWREFLRRYKIFLYQMITYRCLKWQVARLRRQLSDVVNDILSEVFIILNRSLNQFREVEDEKKFRAWLAVICNRAAGRYLKREFINEVADADFEEFQNYLTGIGFDGRWELYESIIARLRAGDAAKKRNLERDINIFQFYVWSDLPQAMIQNHPCYREIGHRVVDNVVNRLREMLKNSSGL